MGNFVLYVEAVGNHGCQRDKKTGSKLDEDCGDQHCTDCMIRRFYKDFSQRTSVIRAHILHWPDGSPTILDNLKTGIRQGTF